MPDGSDQNVLNKTAIFLDRVKDGGAAKRLTEQSDAPSMSTEGMYERLINIADFAAATGGILELGAGSKIIMCVQGSTPGASLNLSFNAAPSQLTNFKPGSKYTLPFNRVVLTKGADCIPAGTIRLLVVVQEGVDYEELVNPQTATGSGAVGPSGAGTQAEATASGGANQPVLATDGISLAGLSGFRFQAKLSNVGLFTGGQFRIWIFDPYSFTGWARTATIDVPDLGLNNYQSVDYPVSVRTGRVYVECDNVTASIGGAVLLSITGTS